MTIKNKSIKLQSLIPALWASLVDISITALHQDPGYWRGDLSLANEANPLGSYLMQLHVSGLFIISTVWLIIIGLLGYSLPKIPSRIFLLSVLVAHTLAASTWISSRYGLATVLILVIVNSSVYILNENFNFLKIHQHSLKIQNNKEKDGRSRRIMSRKI